MSKLRKSARGRDCQIRIPGVCNHNPETVVLCHLPGGGIGAKVNDIHAAYGCSACHDFVDGRNSHAADMHGGKIAAQLWFYDAVIRTQEIMLKEGLIRV